MKTTDCNCLDLSSNPPDARKHVNYVEGMVLGADDLVQEFAYHTNQRQWLARETIGFGTLSGLQVDVVTREQTKGPEVRVSPGVALSPRGQLIRVAPQQCAVLKKWVEASGEQLRAYGFTGLGLEEIPTFVTLCFRDCLVDELPVPGDPCRCESQTKAPSRVLDDFRLELRLTAPAQREEDAIRLYIDWIRQLPVVENVVGGGIKSFVDALREATRPWTTKLPSAASPLSPISPPSPPSPLSPPAPDDLTLSAPPPGLVIPASHMCEYLKAAMKLWVVELRPFIQSHWKERVGGACGCHGTEQVVDGAPEECLLLAKLVLKFQSGGLVRWAVDDSRRPLVVHLRMLQEMLLCRPCCSEAGVPSPIFPESPLPSILSGDATGAINANIVSGIQGRRVDMSPAQNLNLPALAFDAAAGGGGRWRLATLKYRPRSGVVDFGEVYSPKLSKPIEHGCGTNFVMIRLALQFPKDFDKLKDYFGEFKAGDVLGENNETFLLRPIQGSTDLVSPYLPFPAVTALWNANASTFRIAICDWRDPVKNKNYPMQWLVRWWAFPIADEDYDKKARQYDQ